MSPSHFPQFLSYYYFFFFFFWKHLKVPRVGSLRQAAPRHTFSGTRPPGGEPSAVGGPASFVSVGKLPIQTWLLQILPRMASIYESTELSWLVMSPSNSTIISSRSSISPTKLSSGISSKVWWNLIKSCEIQIGCVFVLLHLSHHVPRSWHWLLGFTSHSKY